MEVTSETWRSHLVRCPINGEKVDVFYPVGGGGVLRKFPGNAANACLRILIGGDFFSRKSKKGIRVPWHFTTGGAGAL